tara:strand:+ start:156 stop:947 length:792 start_codon:yes stop_codon:yes gene_type:complete
MNIDEEISQNSEITEIYSVKDLRIMDVKDFDTKKLDIVWNDITPIGWRLLFDLHHNEIRDAGKVISMLIHSKGHELCPQPWDIYRSFSLCPWYMVKVIIIGQDPYYQINDEPVATGCCFETRKGSTMNRSLENMMLVLHKTIPDFVIPEDGDLSKWAQQGVLLLNASLTTTKGTPNAHKDIWRFMPIRVLQFLGKMRKNSVYMLWGVEAKKYAAHINKATNCVLEANHPVARSANNSFLNCDHFNEANEYLIQHDKSPIDWKL